MGWAYKALRKMISEPLLWQKRIDDENVEYYEGRETMGICVRRQGDAFEIGRINADKVLWVGARAYKIDSHRPAAIVFYGKDVAPLLEEQRVKLFKAYTTWRPP